MMKLRKNQKGFTLIEVLLIVVILGIIAAIAIPRLLASRQEAQTNSCHSTCANINTALEKYFFDTGGYPLTIAALVAATYDDANGNPVKYLPDGDPVCPAGGVYGLTSENRATCGAGADFGGHGDIYGTGAGT